MNTNSHMNDTITEFKQKFQDLVLTHHDQIKDYYFNCEGFKRDLLFVFKPQNESQIISFIKLCYEKKISFYPISKGRNWGYGSSLPTKNNLALVDLSLLDTIVLDEDLGLVNIQPGVTTQKLYEYLEKNNSRWMTPLTGAGPTGSLLGNAIERGFGLNPIMDHFESVISIKAILSDGNIYESRLANMGAHKSDQVSRWKIGPYMEGLFSQSNLGVITNITIQLAPKPYKVDFILIKGFKNQLASGIKLCHQLHLNYGPNIGGINFSDSERIQSTVSSSKSKPSLIEIIIKKIIGIQLLDFQIILPVFIPSPAYRSLSNSILKEVKKTDLKALTIKEGLIYFLLKLKPVLNFKVLGSLWEQLESLKEFINQLKGKPGTFTLKVAYTNDPSKNKTFNPAKDQVGLLWFAPILRLKTEDFEVLIQIFETILPKFNQKPMWTFTVLNRSLVEATIPIYFDSLNSKDQEKAMACWKALFDECLKEGFAPYRYSIEHMELNEYRSPHLKSLQTQIKNIFDPSKNISPGRYLS